MTAEPPTNTNNSTRTRNLPYPLLVGGALVLLVVISGVFLWYRERTNPQVDYNLTGPFEELNYPQAKLEKLTVTISQVDGDNNRRKIPVRASFYQVETQIPQLLSQEEGLKKLQEQIGLAGTTRQMSAGQGIFWYQNDRYLSYDQNNKSLTYTLNLRAQTNLPPKKSCPSDERAISFTRNFLKQSQLSREPDNLHLDYQVTREELTPLGLLPSTENCQVVQVIQEITLGDNVLISNLGNSYVRSANIDNQLTVVGFSLRNPTLKQTYVNLRLKTLEEIKNALQGNQGVIRNSCPLNLENDSLELNFPNLAYLLNYESKTAQPVFILKSTKNNSSTCQTEILVRALKENYYR